MFITKRALPRRTFLRAMGATVALPMLDAMVPALSAQRLTPPPRLGFIYIANGVIQNLWNPATTGAGFELTPILQPFASVRGSINVLSGLSHLQADTFGDGTGDHPRASAVWLTGVHAYDRAQPGVEVKLATTADQLAAQAIGRTSRIPSLELSVDQPTQGSCDSGDCFYVNTVSWRNEKTPNPTETHPRIVFERLFGDGGTRPRARRARGPRAASSIRVREEARRVAGSLGRGGQREAGRVSRLGAGGRTADSERRGPAGRRSSCRSGPPTSRSVRRAYQADVRSAGAGVPGRHHARLQHGHVARAEHAHLRQHRRARAAPRRLASSQRSRR